MPLRRNRMSRLPKLDRSPIRTLAMNQVITNILERRSIRKFTPDQISRPDLESIVQAGLYAPSARNTQAWHFSVLQGTALIDKLTAEVKAATARMPGNPYKDFVGGAGYTINYHAPTFILVAGDPKVSTMIASDCALALGNMFLAAHSLGIGSCWINQLCPLGDEPGFRQVLDKLGVPAGYQIYGCGAFGYAQSRPKSAPARREGTVTYVEDF
jgi:nitroreductase